MFDLLTATRAEQMRRGKPPLPPVPRALAAKARELPVAPRAAIAVLPPDVLFVDVETYFDADYSLQKLTLLQYLRDPRFQIHGVGVSFQGRRHWLSAEEFKVRALKTPWHRLSVAAHNAQFDASVLAWHFGIRPARWLDTLAMARGAYPQLPDYALGALAERFTLGKKMDTLAAMAGVREPGEAQMESLRHYNENDLLLLECVYALLAADYPEGELALIDQTVRQCTEPCLVLNASLLRSISETAAEQRRIELAACGVPIDDLRSAPRFAEHLAALGVSVPRKTSTKTGKEGFAFSLKDPAFMALEAHPEAPVRDLVRARLNAMSNLVASRADRMTTLAALGPLPVELNYYGAATGRFSGGGGVNLQNLPHDSGLRQTICAPDGHLLVGCDSAQIEARILAWFAGEQALLGAFRAGRDVYCEFASVFFGREISKADSTERKVGKTAILGLGYGMGTSKFASNLEASGLSLSQDDVARLHQTYRKTYPRIQAAWYAAESAVRTGNVPFGRLGLVCSSERVRLPNGLSLHYPEHQREADEQWQYAGRRGRETLYGGKIIENVIQALARLVVMDQLLVIAKVYRVVFSVHDEIVCCVPEEMAEACKQRLLEVMATPPSWALDLPLACEAVVGKSYGDL